MSALLSFPTNLQPIQLRRILPQYSIAGFRGQSLEATVDGFPGVRPGRIGEGEIGRPENMTGASFAKDREVSRRIEFPQKRKLPTWLTATGLESVTPNPAKSGEISPRL